MVTRWSHPSTSGQYTGSVMPSSDVTVVIRYDRGIWLHKDTATPEKFLLMEHWTSEEAYAGPHMRTPHLTAFVGRAFEFLAGPPEITFWRGIASATP